MSQELEIKLTLSHDSSLSAYQWLTSCPQARPGATRNLVNVYYDTPHADLNRARAALRIRQAGNRYIQTLKTQGEFVNGAHRRQEWEWELASPALDLGLLEQTALAGRIDLDGLAPVFETNFERKVVMLDDGEAVIECAFDTGVVQAAQHSMRLGELEFELKSGDEGRLLYWAKAVADEVPLFVNLISKAEQGYHLAGLHEPDDLGAGVDAVTRFFHGASVLWLNGIVTDDLSEAMIEIEPLAAALGDASLQADWRALLAGPDRSVVERLGRLQLALLAAAA